MGNLTRGTVVWSAVDGRPTTGAGPWLWSERQDLFWIAGVGSLLFGLVATPVSLAIAGSSALLVTAFLHLGALCNLPHYAATYQLIVRERHRAKSSFVALVASIPCALGAIAAGVIWPVLIGPLTRLYLTWSVYHYAAQHFGIASMYQTRGGAVLSPVEKRGLQLGFVATCLHLMVVLNMRGGFTTDSVFGSRVPTGLDALLPATLYPAAIAAAAVGLAAFGATEYMHRRRTGTGLGAPARLLFLSNFVWFVVPFARRPGASGPWSGPNVETWVAFALPFFHCAQYLGVTLWRARTTGAVKPVYLFALLVAVGVTLFEGGTSLLGSLTRLGQAEALLLVPSVLNVHHFVLDGLMWKARRRPVPMVVTGPSVTEERAITKAA